MPGSEVGSAYAKISLDSKEFESGMSGANSKFSSFVAGLESKAGSTGKAIGTALAAGAVAAGAALAGVATIGTKSYMDIESAAADAASKMDLGEIAQKSGKTVGEAFIGIKEHVIAVSRELGQLNTNAFDPTQIATALAGLAAGGFDVASASAENLSSILSLATATNYDLADSAKLSMSTLNQFGMGVDQLGRVSDVYTLASGKSAASMKDFDYAMQQAGPVAQGVGMSFEELTARISKLADAGYSGEKSGTALRTAFMALTSPTKTQTETLAKLGLTFDDVNPRQHTFSETMDLLLSKGADIYDFGEIYGKEGAAIVYSTAKQNEAVKGLTTELVNSKGAAEQMAKMMLDTLKGSFDAAMGAATDLAIGIGEDLAPTIKGLLDWFSATGAPAIREFYEAFNTGDWSKVGETISSGIKAGWANLKDLGEQLLGWIKGVDWGGLGSYIVQGIKAAWNELMSLGGQLLSALMAVDWASVGTSILDAISSAIDSVIDYAQGIYDYFAGIDWAGVWDSLVSAFNSAIESLSNIGSTILGYFDEIDWGTVGFKIGQAIRDAINALSDIGSQIWQYLTSADWGSAGSSIAEKIKGGLQKLNEFWNEFKTGVSAVDFATAGKEIGDKIKAGLGQIADYAKSIYDKIEKGWDDWIAADGPKKLGEDFGHSLIKGVADLGKWIYDAIANYWKSNGSSIGSNFTALFNSAINFAKIALQAAYDFVTGFADTVVKAGKGTIGAAILEVVGGAMNDVYDGLGADLLTKAEEWRKDAAELWEASPLDLTIAETAKLVSGDLPKDKETRNVNVVLTTTGEDITAKINKISGSSGVTGGKGISLRYSPADSTYYMVTDPNKGEQTTTTEQWAYQMGAAGANLESFTAKLREAQNNAGFSLQIKDVEKFTAAFTRGQDAYNSANKPPGEDFKEDVDEAGEGLKEDAKEAGDTEVAGAKEDAAIGVAGAKEEAKATKEAALTFRQQIWKTVSDVDQVYRNTHEAVKIGLTSTGQKIAIIGEVAQRQFEQAGGQWLGGVAQTKSEWIEGVRVSYQGLDTSFVQNAQKITTSADLFSGKVISSAIAAGGNFQSKIDVGTANQVFKLNAAATDNAAKTVNVANYLRSQGVSAADYNYNKQVAGGNWIYEKAVGAANALATAAIKIGSSTYKFSYNNPFATLSSGSSSSTSSSSSSSASSSSKGVGPWGAESSLSGWGGTPKGWAEGTITTGPQMALIGEDGPANPEYVIPTKTKRWDLLFAAMRSYGIPGFAEGTATGEAAAGAVDPDAMAAYFSITGLASMSKQVQRIINNLKDFFRISWGIIKSESAVYWRQINTVVTTEVTAFRDTAWQAFTDVRNTAILSFQEILAGAKSAFSEMWPDVSGYVDDLAEGLVSSMEDAGSSTVDAINQMVLNAESSLSAWATKWGETWDQMLTDLSDAQSQISTACSEIAAELAKINVNVNISSSGGSYGGGGSSGGMDWNFGGDDDWLAPTGDWSDYGYRQPTTGPCPLGGGCPNYNQAVRDSIMPLDDRYIGGGGGGGYYTGPPSGYPLPWIFAARGAKIDGPQRIIAGEAGPELVIPATYTRLMDWMAGQVENLRVGDSAQRIVIEDHTEHRWFLDGKEVTDSIMDRVVKQLKLKGAVPVR